MGRPRKWPPSIYSHPARGVDRVRINGRDVTLGATGSEQARAAYLKIIALDNKSATLSAVKRSVFTVADLAAWWPGYAERTFRNGSSEPRHGERVLKVACEAIGDCPAAELTPKRIRAVQSLMLSRWARSNVNRQIVRLKTIVRRACDEEVIPPEVYQRIVCVKAVRRGTPGATETSPRTAVSRETLDAVLAEVSVDVGAILELMWLTGARPGEIRVLRTCDVEQQSPGCWVYRPAAHKGSWRGAERVIPLGPRAIETLRPWLRPFEPERAAWLTIRGNVWTSEAIAHEVKDACGRAGVKMTPYQLRHAFKRRATDAGGVAAAMAALGQTSSEAFDRYDKGGDVQAAIQLARKIG